jgi:aryl-phospho-beta-D-glucosidase BglC (GH1 family)
VDSALSVEWTAARLHWLLAAPLERIPRPPLCARQGRGAPCLVTVFLHRPVNEVLMSAACAFGTRLRFVVLACILSGLAAGSLACASSDEDGSTADREPDALSLFGKEVGAPLVGAPGNTPLPKVSADTPSPPVSPMTAPVAPAATPGADAPATTTTVAATPINATSPPPSNLYTAGVRFRGINRAGPEFGNEWSGWTGQSFYTWPTATELSAELAYLDAAGFNMIRLPISWERLQHTLNGPFNAAYETQLKRVIGTITAAGFYCILDLHNYNRYAVGTHTGDQADAQLTTYVQHVLGDGTLTNAHVIDVWKKLGSLFKDNARVQFNLMNESHDFPITSDAYVGMINEVVAAIRSTGATNMVIVPNSRASDITHFGNYSPNGGSDDFTALRGLVDPAKNLALDMHQYLTGTVSSGTQYVGLNFEKVTSWARANGFRCYLTELGVDPAKPYAKENITSLLAYLDANADVWIGWSPWNLVPYKLTGASYAVDGPSMPWYRPFMNADTVKLL